MLICQDFGFCQDFVSMEKEGKNLDPQKCDCKYIALKNDRTSGRISEVRPLKAIF